MSYRGELSDPEKFRVMKGSTLFVTASRSEGWGIAIAEGLACGLPAVCYDLVTLRSVWSSCPNVTFIPVGDLERFAKEVAVAFLDGDSGGLTTRDCVKHLDWADVAENDYRFILEVLTHQSAS